MKIDRSIIYKKFNGHCAYCGCQLNGKFQVDHLIPKRNFVMYYRMGKIPVFLKGLTEFDMNHIDNLMPSCGSCNNYKSTFDLELFRHEIGQLVKRLNSTFTQYKIAKRFGLIREVDVPVKFYFEDYLGSCKPNHP